MQWHQKPKVKSHIYKKLPRIISDLLVLREIKTQAELDKYFTPKEDSLHNPALMPNISRAIARIEQAVLKNEKIVIYGDYDVDGVCSTSILWDFLYRKLGADVIPFIPSRFSDGYGLNETSLKEIQKSGATLIITVDCGVRDAELIDKFKDLDFVITDHHSIPEENSWDHIVVHPGLNNSKYPFKELCAAAVIWKLICAYTDEKNLECEPKEYLDLVAFATVCDIMPLVEENRTIVKLGLERMRETENLGLQELIKVSGIDQKDLDTYHLGFVLGPRVNAVGRLGDAMDAVRLLTTRSREKAEQLAKLLDEQNKIRQQLTIDTLEMAEEMMGQFDKSRKIIFVYGKAWNDGIVGLVAGRLMEKYNRPVISATIHRGIVKGSARSMNGFDITNAISQSSEILKKYGGHAQAAGFTLEHDNLEAFRDSLEKIAEDELQDFNFTPSLEIDNEINLEDINPELLDWLDKFRPFGLGNKNIVLLIKDLEVLNKKLLGKEKNHVRFMLNGKQDRRTRGLEAIGFNLASVFENININDRIDVVGSLGVNEWNGTRTIQMRVKDARKIK